MPSSVTWNETAMTIAGSKMHLTRAGSGRPVLVLHHDIGTPDRLPFYDTLAQNFDVLVPHHPGWGKSERPQWLRSVRDIAAMHSWLLGDLGAERCIAGRAGFRRLDRRRDGEPVADRLSQAGAGRRDGHQAARRRHRRPGDRVVSRLSAGRLPRPGRVHPRLWRCDHGPARAVGHRREMVFRTAWKPYMYSQTLPHLLGGVKRRRWWSGATMTGTCRKVPATPT